MTGRELPPPEQLAEIFRDELEQCRFPQAGSHVTCAVSGGADSSALLVLARAAGCDATAVHVDHGLREGSADEVDAVAALAAAVGARFESKTVTVEPGSNLEARARHARYAVLPADVLTGHTADDQAETMLLNLMWGSGVDGMAGMRCDGRRPLIGLRRQQTVEVCARLGIEPFDDPSNASPLHRRNRVRHELIPLLNDIAQRDVVPILCRQAELFADDRDLLDALAAELDPTDAKAISAAPQALSSRALRAFLTIARGADHPPDRATVERALDVASGTARATDVGEGWRLRRSTQRLFVDPPKPKLSQP